MFDRQNYWFARPYDSLSSLLSATWHQQAPLKPFILKWFNFQTKHCKKLIMLLKKLACFFNLFCDQRISSIHQLLSWTSVGPSKCKIDKMISSQGPLTFRIVPCVQRDIIKNSFKIISFFRNDWISNPNIEKKFDRAFEKISLLFKNCFMLRGYQALTNCSVGLQLICQNDMFATLSHSLSISLNPTWYHQ